jgi:hypothetical protein
MVIKKAAFILCAVLVSAVLAACGGDDPDPTATPAATVAAAVATATTASAEATPTEDAVPPPPTEEAVTPTMEPEATSTVAPTATVAPTGTPDAVGAEPTATTAIESTPAPTSEFDPGDIEALFAMALTEEDFPEGWAQIFAAPVTDIEDGLTFCNAEPFSSPEGRRAAVELEFELSPMDGPFVLQNLTAYPEAVSIEAMEYARNEVVNCDEWTDELGTTYQLTMLELPEYGDESFGIRFAFEIPEFGEMPVAFAFVRVGGILLSIGYIDMEAIDRAFLEGIIERAVEKVEASDFQP